MQPVRNEVRMSDDRACRPILVGSPFDHARVEREPNERDFTIMPVAGHLLRILEVYPPQAGGKRTIVHRTRTLDYVVMLEGELVLLLDDSDVTLRQGDEVHSEQ